MATTPWPPAAQMLITPRPVPSSCSCLASDGDDPPAGRGERVAGGERAAVDVELGAVDRAERLVAAELLLAERRVLPGLQRAEHLRGEGLVDLVVVEVAEAEAGAVEHPRHRVGGRHQQPLALVDVVDGGGLGLDQVGEDRQVVLLRPLLAGEQHGGAPSESGVELAAVIVPLLAAEDRLQLGQLLGARSRGAGSGRARGRGRG